MSRICLLLTASILPVLGCSRISTSTTQQGTVSNATSNPETPEEDGIDSAGYGEKILGKWERVNRGPGGSRFTFEFKKDGMAISVKEDNGEIHFPYRIEKDKLVFPNSHGKPPMVYVIKEITSTKLVMTLIEQGLSPIPKPVDTEFKKI